MRKRGDGEAERCESGCSEPVAHHDVEGVPLCQACWDEVIAAGPDAYEDTPEEAAVLVGETVVVPTAVPPGSGEARGPAEVPQGPVEAAGRRVRWRVGRSVGRTLYLDNVLVGLMDDASLARTVVTALTEMGQRIDGEAGNDAATAARLQAHAEGRAEGLREAVATLGRMLTRSQSRDVQAFAWRAGVQAAFDALAVLAASPPSVPKETP